MDVEDICAVIRAHQDEIEQRYGVSKLGVFGSHVRGDQDESSDIDIVVEMDRPNMFRAFFSLKLYLSQLLGAEVDLGLEHALKPAVREQVRKEIRYVWT